MRVLVFGAGVIGQIYAGRLVAAGHSVQLVARGSHAEQLGREGITLKQGKQISGPVFPAIVDADGQAQPVEVALVAIRRDQFEGALPQLARLRADTVASLINLPTGLDELAEAVGPARFIPAFPGMAGKRLADGTIEFLELAQQPTTIGSSPSSLEHVRRVNALLETAGLRAAVANDMDAWLKTHAIFIAAFESALAARGGDARALGVDRAAVRELVAAVRQALDVLNGRGTQTAPTALRVIFQRMPLWFSTRYWARQLVGPLGTLGLAPHAVATRYTELPTLQREVHSIIGAGTAPRWEALFAGAGD